MSRRQLNRPRWVCRLIGHRHRDPFFGRVVSIYMPSAEGSMGLAEKRRLIGTCGCGHEWRASR